MHVRSPFALAALVALVAGASPSTPATVASAALPEPPLPGVLARLSGVWSEVLVTEDHCGAAARPHEFEVSPDGLRLTQRFHVPVFPGDAAPEVRRYRILYGDDDSVVLYREDESFEDAATGDRVIRELVLHSPESYRWRLLGKPRDWRATMAGRRCPVGAARDQS